MNQAAAAATNSGADPKLIVRQVGPTFAAEVTGMPIHGDVSPELLAEFVSLLHRYRVLIVPEARSGVGFSEDSPDPADLVAFSRRFGPLEIPSRSENTLSAHREVFCFGNVERGGVAASFDREAESWHGDNAPDAYLLRAQIVPNDGGETLFADATAAWRTLESALKRQVEDLYAVHSPEAARRHNPGCAPGVDDQSAAVPPMRRKLVRTHPATGAKSLHLPPELISRIEDTGETESAALIETLTMHMTQARFVYRHRWHKGDLVMWDNRAVALAESLFGHTRHQCLMYVTAVAGNAPALAD